MKKFFVRIFLVSFLAFLPKVSLAHCPLCTIGAGALAVLAASLGVSSVVVGVLIGAFATALSLWLSGLVKKKYIPYQKAILSLLIFISTIVPIMPFIRDYGPFYISLWGPYGTLVHNTYTINLFVLGSLLGAFIMIISPFLSRAITKIRGKQIAYQGVTLTLFLLILTSVLIQTLS